MIKYRNDEEMKDSGVEWLGRIPKEWEEKRLRYIASIDTGNKDTQDRVEDGEYPFYVRSDVVERINSYSFDGEAILTAGDGVGVGKVFHYVDGKFAFHQRVYKLSDFKYIYGKLLYYYIVENFHKEVIKLSAKSTVDSLRRPMFSDFIVTFPQKTEQQKIANFLDYKTAQFDSIISKKEKLIEKLEEAKKSLISEVVTGKVKIVDGKLVERDLSEMKDSGVEWLGMIPKDWEVTKIKYISKLNERVLNERTTPNKLINYIDIGSVNSTGFISQIQEYEFKAAPSRARRIVRKNDIIVSTVRTYLRAIAYIENKYDNYICSTGFAVITPNLNLIYQEYFYFVIQSNKFVDQVVSRSAGVSYPAINGSDLIDLNFSLPNLNEQEKMLDFIRTKIDNIKNSVDLTLLQIQKLKQAKQSLISEAVTGKIDLRDWELIPEGEAV